MVGIELSVLLSATFLCSYVHERLPSGETRTLVYRGQRVVPHRRRSFGWFATVSHWDVEDHEIQIDFERDLVRDIQARIRRSQLGARA